MKHYVLFLFVLIQFASIAQKATSIQSAVVSSSSITSTIIHLNPITGNKFFTIDTKNISYAYLYSYEDFKKQFQDLNAKGDEKYIQEFIFKNLEDNFSKKDTLNPYAINELNTYNRFKEMVNKFLEESLEKNNFAIIEKKTGKKETKLVHKEGTIYTKDGKKGEQDEYFLSDEKTAIFGSAFKYKIKVSK